MLPAWQYNLVEIHHQVSTHAAYSCNSPCGEQPLLQL